MPGWLSHFFQRALLASCLLLPASGFARTEVLITGEWPPYTGVREPQGGSVTAVVRQALAAEGLDVRIGFFGWNRLRPLMATNKDYSGRFPDYYSPERAKGCHYSNVIGESPLGLAELRTRPLHWNRVEDLVHYRVGTVKTYVNAPLFDRLASEGKIRTVESADDEGNLMNLLNGAVDAAIIDRNVYAYLISRSPRLKAQADKMQLNQKVLIVHRLYVCFSRNEDGRKLRDSFNRGLMSLQAPGPK